MHTGIFGSNFVQAQSELTYKGTVMKEGKKLPPAKVREIMAGNNEALKSYNTGQALGVTGVVLASSGGFLLGFELGAFLGGREVNIAVLGAGAGGLAIGLVFALVGDSQVRKSVMLYNLKLNNNQIPYQVHLGFTKTGVGLSLRF